MIVKLDIVKAAKVLAKLNIENYYRSLNPNVSDAELLKIIYICNETELENGVKVETIVDLKPTIKIEAQKLYDTYFKILKDIKNYN